MKKNVIQLNGRLYDAVTGKMLDKPNSSAAKTVNKPQASATQKKKPSSQPTKSVRSKSIDGFGRITNKLRPKPKATTQNKATTKSATPATNVKTKPASPAKATRQRAKNNMQAQLQHTSTLRRSIVKKPTSRLVSSDKKLSKPAPAKPNHSANNIKFSIKRSPAISRFARLESSNYSIPHLKQKEPTSSSKTAKLNKAKPAIKTVSGTATKEALIAESFAKLDKATKSSSTTKKSGKRQRVNRHIKKHRKTASILAGGLAVLLIGLYVIYLNVPNMAIKFAASRAGFDASLPHYSPSGYSFSGPIKYQPGQVTISFKSNSDDRKYSILEQPSQWDSEAVFKNYVSKQSDKPPYTIQDSGLTIYMFGDSSAAWVNGGKFFAINGKAAQLSNQQLLNIATSL